MRYFIKISFLLFLTACKNHNVEDNKKIQDTAISQFSKANDNIETKDEYNINENIVEELLGFPAGSENIDRVKLPGFELTKSSRINTHNNSVTDTIYTYQNKASNFTFYKASDRYILCDFSISENNVALQNEIKIGISKSEILKKLKLNIQQTDTIKIGDLEQNSVVNLIFKNEKLSSIKYKGYVD
ncbi:MAG: hypothetical protein V4497_12790 [Bacteroidota bacterium]